MDNVRVIRREITKLCNKMELGVLEVSEDTTKRVKQLAMRLAAEHERLFDSGEGEKDSELGRIKEYTDKVKQLQTFVNDYKAVAVLPKIPEVSLKFSGAAKDWKIFKTMFDTVVAGQTDYRATIFSVGQRAAGQFKEEHASVADGGKLNLDNEVLRGSLR
ncbi:UNVERIFIED_CONTAM: hypothetical protein PYX00_008826 [Menopon gallinae]|uniref:Uncharacterized protein n=1 Tax=Menopon gallinae TaxID=328185 RepID=A0AAW2HPK5_9NEOP